MGLFCLKSSGSFKKIVKHPKRSFYAPWSSSITFSNMECSNIPPSLVLQILFTFNKWFIYFWFPANLILFKYKDQNMIYSPSSYRWELAMIFFTFGLDLGRIEIGSRANKLKQYGPRSFILPLLLSLPSMLASVFFLRLQSYV